MGQITLYKTISINAENNIYIYSFGQYDTSVLAATNQTPFYIDNSNNINFADLKISLNSGNSFFEIKNSANITIKRCQMSGTAVKGIKIDKNSKYVNITNNNISGYIEYGIQAESKNVIIANNSFYKGTESYYEDNNTKILLSNVTMNQDEQLNMVGSILLGDRYGKGFDPITEESEFSNKTYGTYFYELWYNNFSENYVNWIQNNICFDCKTYNFQNFAQMLTNIPLYLTKKQDFHDDWAWNGENAKFQHVNPQFLKWLRENWLLTTTDNILGQTLQFYYDKAFKNTFRTYLKSYINLQNSPLKTTFIDGYKENDNNRYYLDYFMYESVISNLHEVEGVLYDQEVMDGDGGYDEGEEYEGEGESESESEDTEVESDYSQWSEETLNTNYYLSKVNFTEDISVNLFDLSRIYSFWIRRNIDGSAEEIMKTMLFFMKKYDNDWATSIESSIIVENKTEETVLNE
ncbi:MAG: right-handed parallel beta-helix repeat-containing protein [Bacteroidales bacterium]|nr:right-handed parallel beta-helix repeat-containing protein [Bacteroidales bacterium]